MELIIFFIFDGVPDDYSTMIFALLLNLDCIESIGLTLFTP